MKIHCINGWRIINRIMSKVNHQYNHYIPQFYLRNFSDNKKGIGTYMLHQRKFVANNSIRRVGGKDFLYGKDGTIEKWFEELEGKWSKIIDSIIENEKIQTDSEDYTYLLMFIYLSDARTSQVADYKNAQLQQLVDIIIKNDKHNEKLL